MVLDDEQHVVLPGTLDPAELDPYGEEGQLQQVSQIVWCQAFPHPPSLAPSGRGVCSTLVPSAASMAERPIRPSPASCRYFCMDDLTNEGPQHCRADIISALDDALDALRSSVWRELQDVAEEARRRGGEVFDERTSSRLAAPPV